MYHVAGTGIAIITLYLIFLLFQKIRMISSNDNRKIWNLILAITFIITGAAGIVLAIRINYKLKGDFFDQLLRWHVETGIAFSFTGIIHFIRHLPYFRNLFRGLNTDINTEPEIKETDSSLPIGLNLFFLGFVSTSVQLLLLREIINITGGYELIAGTYFAAWLITSASGSFLAGRTGKVSLRSLNIAIAATPVLSVILLIISGRVFLHPGETPSFLRSILLTVIILLPVCVVSGFSFIRLLDLAHEKGFYSSGKSFSIETAGGILSGLLITFLSSGIIDSYQMLFTVLLLFVIFISVSTLPAETWIKPLLIFFLTVLIMLTIWFSPSVLIRQITMPGIKVTGSKDSPYGNITTGEYRGEHFVYYNNRLVRWSYDETEREESVHYTLLQHSNPERILIISGDISSLYNEVMKYSPENIVFVERDPELLRSVRNEMAEKSNIRIIEDDAFRYMRNTQDKFDVIMMNLPPPSSLQLNRYYTEEFIRLVRSRLDSPGVFCCSPGVFENYFNEQSANLYSIVFNTIRKVFRNVIPIGGNRLYLIASDGNLQTSICSLYKKRGIENLYVNCNYLDDELIQMKSSEIENILNRETKINSLSNPLATYFYQTYNLTRTPGKTMPALLLLAILFIIPSVSVPARNLSMYAAAFSLAGFEIYVLLSIQSVIGNIYHLTGLVLSTVMAGLATGSGIKFKMKQDISVSFFLFVMFLFYVFVYFINSYLPSVKYGTIYTGFILLLCFIPSFLTGCIFRLMSEERNQKSSVAGVYASDLTGSALGFIAVSALLLPLAGSGITILTFAGITLTAFIFALLRSRH